MVEAPISPPSTSRDTGISMSSPNRDDDPNYDPHESEEESEDELDKILANPNNFEAKTEPVDDDGYDIYDGSDDDTPLQPQGEKGKALREKARKMRMRSAGKMNEPDAILGENSDQRAQRENNLYQERLAP